MLIINQYGLINYLRLYENYHANMKLNDKDKSIRDTRVGYPFKELHIYAMDVEMGQMSEIEHKHVPYVVILIKALEKFKEKYNRNPNDNQLEKKEFKEIILSMKKFNDEENFNEALYHVYDVTNSYLEVKILI
jgi:amyloid beta precursor protein binding protein 1